MYLLKYVLNCEQHFDFQSGLTVIGLARCSLYIIFTFLGNSRETSELEGTKIARIESPRNLIVN
jgi:hypothetical protein